jgi:hypothetical protein
VKAPLNSILLRFISPDSSVEAHARRLMKQDVEHAPGASHCGPSDLRVAKDKANPKKYRGLYPWFMCLRNLRYTGIVSATCKVCRAV